MNDTNCDPFNFTYVINTAFTKSIQNILVHNISDFPSVVNGARTSADYLSVYTQSYLDSAYEMNFTIIAYTPDKRTSSSVPAIICLNHYSPTKIGFKYSNFTFVQVDKITHYENLIFDLGNYFMISKCSNPYNLCNLVHG